MKRIRNHISFRKKRIVNSLKEKGILLTKSERRLKKLKNKHQGETSVIIGMGPSLKVSDLELFRGVTSFACNKIYLAFDQVDWRPEYYSVCDVLVAKNNKERILETDFRGAIHLHSLATYGELKFKSDAIFYGCSGSIPKAIETNSKMFSNISHLGILSHGYSVLIDQIQLAYYMGFETVYLVGVDFSFDFGKVTKEMSTHGQIIESKGEINHFHKDYRKNGETWTMPMMKEQRIAFEFCEKQFRDSGRQLLNASRASKLDVVPKVAFDNIFF